MLAYSAQLEAQQPRSENEIAAEFSVKTQVLELKSLVSAIHSSTYLSISVWELHRLYIALLFSYDGNCDICGLKPLFKYSSETLLSVCASSAGPTPDGAPPLPAHPGQGDPERECHHPERLALRSPPVLQRLQWYDRKTQNVYICM